MLPPSEERAALWHHLGDHIAAFFDDFRDLPVATEVSPETLRARLASYDFTAPTPAITLINDTVEMLRDWNTHHAHPRCFGLFNPTPAYMGIVADALAAAVNPQLAIWSASPIGAEIEQHLLRYFGSRIGFPEEQVTGSMTTGGAEANMTAILLALTRRFPEVGDHGLRVLPSQPVLYASEESHHAILKIAHATGIGRAAVRFVPTTSDLRMDVEALRRRIRVDKATGYAPFLVVATAGTTSAGIIDPLLEIAQVARETDIQLHVDAAWAGAICMSDELRPLLSGIELADSVTIDAHKWLSVPMGAGMFLCKDRENLHRTFRITTAYMPPSPDEVLDPYTHSIQWSRRFIGLKLFMTLAVAGQAGYAQMIEQQMRLGDDLRQRLQASEWRIVNPSTPLPVVCVRDGTTSTDFPDPVGTARGFDAEEHQYYERLCAEIVRRGRVWISTTRLHGQPTLRLCVTSYLSTTEDIELLVSEMNEVRAAMR